MPYIICICKNTRFREISLKKILSLMMFSICFGTMLMSTAFFLQSFSMLNGVKLMFLANVADAFRV